MRLKYPASLNNCRKRVAGLIGAHVDECVLVPNAIHGINTILRNIGWQKGDAILKSNISIVFCGEQLKYSPATITYDAVDKATRFVADISPHLTLETIDIAPPYTLDGILKAFQAGLKKIQSSREYMAFTEQGKRPKILVIVDAISSNPGILIPWERIVEFCKTQENVWTLVDAAHAIGHIVGINLNETQPDFFVSVGFILRSCWLRLNAEPPRFNRTATSGSTPSAGARFSMSH